MGNTIGAYRPPPGGWPWPAYAGDYFGNIAGPALSHGGYYSWERGYISWIQDCMDALPLLGEPGGPGAGWDRGVWDAGMDANVYGINYWYWCKVGSSLVYDYPYRIYEPTFNWLWDSWYYLYSWPDSTPPSLPRCSSVPPNYSSSSSRRLASKDEDELISRPGGKFESDGREGSSLASLEVVSTLRIPPAPDRLEAESNRVFAKPARG